jgi:hypothetical protein
MCGARGHQPGGHEPREPAHGGDSPELVGLVEADGDLHVGLPQIELHELARLVARALARIRWPEQWSELRHPVAQDGDAVGPVEALGDHRRRHGRTAPKQLTDDRLVVVHERPPALALVVRRRVRTDGGSHGVAGHAKLPGDGLDPQMLGEVQPPDLGPVVHVDHVLPPRLASQPGFVIQHSQWWITGKGGQFSAGDRGSVFTRW